MKIVIRSLFRISPVIYMLLIWSQSSYFNPSSIEHVFYNIDFKVILIIGASLELAHLIEFGLLYLLIIIAFLTFGPLTRQIEYIALIISITYSFIDEMHQYYVPYRSFSYIDMVKNLFGIWFVWFLSHRMYFIRTKSFGGTLLMEITKVFGETNKKSGNY